VIRKLRHAPVARSEAAEHERWLARLAERERAYQPPRYPGGITVLGTEGSIHALHSNALGWERHAAGRVDTKTVPGGHLTMLEPPNLSVLGRELAERVAQARAAAPTV
jgi:thioesterase domain-containing protein